MSSIFQNERTYKQSKVEYILDKWYEINLENNESLPAPQKQWSKVLNKLTEIQYKALRMMFELDPVGDIECD